jgi:hypothetical protein
MELYRDASSTIDPGLRIRAVGLPPGSETDRPPESKLEATCCDASRGNLTVARINATFQVSSSKVLIH